MKHNNADDRDFATFFCPVPIHKLPVNQYRNLKESKFSRWAVLERSKYTTKLLAVWISSLLLTMLVVAAKSVGYNTTLVNLVGSAIVADLAVLFCLIKLYTAWNYVHSRLIKQMIAYELSGSRKIAVWHKTELMLLRDRLIARYQIQPILKRIKQTMSLVSLFLSLNFLILFLIINS